MDPGVGEYVEAAHKANLRASLGGHIGKMALFAVNNVQRLLELIANVANQW